VIFVIMGIVVTQVGNSKKADILRFAGATMCSRRPRECGTKVTLSPQFAFHASVTGQNHCQYIALARNRIHKESGAAFPNEAAPK
jgi:hypothetical protein